MEVNLSPRYPTPNPSLGEGLRRRSGGFSWLIWGFTFFCLSCIIKKKAREGPICGGERTRTAVQTSHQAAFYMLILPLVFVLHLPEGGRMQP